MAEFENSVVVGTYSWILDAEGARIALHAEGIESELENENVASTHAFLATAVGGINLLVAEEDFEKAAEVLKSREIEAAEARKNQCPRCESMNITYKKKNLLYLILGFITLGIFFSIISAPYRCEECNYKWH